MRLLLIDIECFEKEDAKIVGEEDAPSIPSKAMVDLDRVTSFWLRPEPDNDILIYLVGGESYVAKNISFEKFASKMSQQCIGADLPGGRVEGVSNPCPDCGGRTSCDEGKTTCEICGRIVV